MGKIIKDGFTFMEYANSGLIRKIDDIPELKNELITLSKSKTHMEMSKYALLLAEHILNVSGIERSEVIEGCFTIIKKWQDKEAKFQNALEVAATINSLAREEKTNKIKIITSNGAGCSNTPCQVACLSCFRIRDSSYQSHVPQKF